MKLSTIKQFSQENPAFPVGGLNHIIFHRSTNGFNDCFPKVGKRRYIDGDKFFKRVEELNKKDAA